MRTIIDMKTVNEAAPAAPPVTNRTTTTSRGLAVATQPATASRQATDSANSRPFQTSTQTQTGSRVSATAAGGYYMRDLIQIDVNFKAHAANQMATKKSDNMPRVDYTSLDLAIMLKQQIQISRGLKRELLDLHVKYDAAHKELKQVRQESEQYKQEAKARAQANLAWDKEHARRLADWNAAQTAYKTQMDENAAQEW
ncbi:hypothetical protein CGCS363_v001710 [Colletotrichum siamense]|uniref:uncharacterized protein n=1 Tax=Colletotrichum siamense TaxID=690259 RepID=UPI0018728454|nr:uncharacterized protein CGCS363_v001710 [Colletotrichum siamense]KAF5516995.1 hypothetical protein CGCS363_v001710 [Colletotrichum siamense]